MSRLAQTEGERNPARRPNGSVFGTIEEGTLRFHVRCHSIALNSIGLDAGFYRVNAYQIKKILAKVDSLGGLFEVSGENFAKGCFERTLRSDFGSQVFLPVKNWLLVRPGQSNSSTLEVSNECAA